MQQPTPTEPTDAHRLDAFDTAFARLLAQWNDHQELRRRQASTADLLCSRLALDRQRFEAGRRRRALVG